MATLGAARGRRLVLACAAGGGAVAVAFDRSSPGPRRGQSVAARRPSLRACAATLLSVLPVILASIALPGSARPCCAVGRALRTRPTPRYSSRGFVSVGSKQQVHRFHTQLLQRF